MAYNREKIQSELDRVQKGDRVRKLSIEDVDNLIEKCEMALGRMDLPADIMPYVSFRYEFMVANSYNARAMGTTLELTFTKSMKVKSVVVAREECKSEPYGGERARFHLGWKVFQEVYGLSYDFDEKHHKVESLLRKQWGFNQAHVAYLMEILCD